MACIVINHDIPTASSINRAQIMRVEYACFVNKLLPFSSAYRASSISLSLNIYKCENKLHRTAVNATSCLINNMSAVLGTNDNGENSSSSQLEF
jgi:hypothetical protein